MPTVAEQLRTAREQQGLTIDQIAETTKMRTDHVRALEEGNFNVFSAQIYIRGSVKNYATTLKLNVPQVMATLDAELGRTEKFKEPPPLTEQSTSIVDQITLVLAKLNWKMGFAGLVVLGIIGVGIGIFLTLHNHKKSDPSKNLPPAVYQSGNGGDTLPLPRH